MHRAIGSCRLLPRRPDAAAPLAQTPAAAAAGQPPAPPAAAAPAPEAARRRHRQPLRADVGTELTFGGRWNSISGDAARFQRYQDHRDGVLRRRMRVPRREPVGAGCSSSARTTSATAISASPDYERTGRFAMSGLWDQIPQFYSIDTRTPYTPGRRHSDGPRRRDATRIQNGPGEHERRTSRRPRSSTCGSAATSATFSVRATPRAPSTSPAPSRRTRHSGELPWGASFGFSNDVEVALPYDSRTNDFIARRRVVERPRHAAGGVRRARGSTTSTPRSSGTARCASTDSTAAPGRGRMALWPSNTSQTVSAAGYTKFARSTQLTGFLSFGSRSNDEPLQPFTINPTLTQLALPRANAEGDAHIFSDQHRPGLAAERRTGASARGCAGTTSTTRPRRPSSRSSSTTTPPSRLRRPAARSCTRTTHDLRRRRDLDAACRRWPSRPGYTLNSNSYDSPHLREQRRARASPQGRRHGQPVDDVSRALRARRTDRRRPRRAAARPDRRAARAAALRHRRPDAQPLHRPG